MERLRTYFLSFVLAIFLLAGFGLAIGTSTAASKAPVTAKSAANVNEQALWGKVIAEAKREGSVVVATGLSEDVRKAVTASFVKKYDVNVEWLVGRPTELEAKIKAQRAAGISAEDVAMPGLPSFANIFKPMGITVPLEPLLMLREVTDKSKWKGGELPYFDKEKHGIQASLYAIPFYIFNTSQVKATELALTQDLLNPKWKGKIVISDPSIAGAGNDWFTFTVIEIMGRDKGIQFMKDLLKQEPVITRDERMLTEWVARGKYQIGIGTSPAVPVSFIKNGAELAFAEMKEPRELTQGYALLCAFNQSPHPNAQKLFVNWILSREGNSILAQASGYASTRVDGSTDGILPILIPKEGDVNVYKKYDFLSFKNEMMEKAKGIFTGR